MGIGLFRNCKTNYYPSSNFSCSSPSVASAAPAPAPNPNPDRWNLLEKQEYPNGYVLKVHYLDCTNFEGVKVMVFEGKFKMRSHMDPHFHESSDAPIARFRPDADGWERACKLAKSL